MTPIYAAMVLDHGHNPTPDHLSNEELEAMTDTPIGDLFAKPERGEPDIYEIVWMSGHVERVIAHQVSYPHRALSLFGANIFGHGTEEQMKPRVQLHAEINGRWCLTLSALEDDIRTMRLVTEPEAIPDDRR